MRDFELLPITTDTSEAEAVAIVEEWAATAIPAEWRLAAARGGNAELRKVRPRTDYEAWYPNLARVGLVAPMWPREYGGLGLGSRVAVGVGEEAGQRGVGGRLAGRFDAGGWRRCLWRWLQSCGGRSFDGLCDGDGRAGSGLR